MKKSEKILSGIVLSLAVGLGGTLYYRTYINPWDDVSANDGNTQNQLTEEEAKKLTETNQASGESDLQNDKIYNVTQSGLSLEERGKIRGMFFDMYGKLTSPVAGEGDGFVKAHFMEEKYYLYMKATGLTELAMEGDLITEDVYQGWLVNAEGDKFVMLNVAEKVDGGYEILFVANENLIDKFPKFVLSKQNLGSTQNGPGAVVLEATLAK